MKLFVFICLLMFVHEKNTGQTFLRLRDGVTMQESQSIIPRRTIKNVDNGILVTYEFDHVEILPDDIYPNASIININGFGFWSEVEAPALPIKLDRFLVPSNNCRIIITDSTFIELPMEIGPTRPPMGNSTDGISNNQFVKPIRPFHGLFPECAISNMIYAYHKSYIAEIRVTPVQYDYQRKKVRLFSKLSYLVEYRKDRQIKLLDKNYIKDDCYLSNLVTNPIDTIKITRDNASEVEVPSYLILSVPQFSNAVNLFAEWKRTLGYDVKTLYQSSWTETDVSNAIASSNTDYSLRYLLIVGDYEDIPGNIISDSIMTTSGWQHFTYATDYYYGCVQQSTYPEIRRGRLSVSSANEAMTVINKIIQYEKAPVTQQSFYDTGLNCAYFQDEDQYNDGQLVKARDGIEDVRFTLTSENIRDYLVNIKGKTINRVYKTADSVNPQYWNDDAYGFYGTQVSIPGDLLRSNGFLWNGGSANITQYINDGAFYILHRDHGLKYRWAIPTFSFSHVNHLSNQHKLPVVFSMNCLTGKYNGITCFAESFLRKEGGGCVAIYAASAESLSGYNDALTIGMFDAIWPSNGYFKSFPHSHTISLASTPAYKLGDILDIGLSQILSIYEFGYNGTALKHTKEIFHCFGDPAMEIYTALPTIFNNVSFSVVNNLANISVPEGGRITIYNPTTGDIASYDGSDVQFPFDQDLRISISKHNKIPLIIEAGTLFLQNTTIAENVSYKANTIKIGDHVTTTKPTGEVRIISGVIRLNGKTVELSSGTTVELGAKLEINN